MRLLIFSPLTLFVAEAMQGTAAQLAVFLLVVCAPNGVVCELGAVMFYHGGDNFVVREAEGVNTVRCELLGVTENLRRFSGGCEPGRQSERYW